MSTTKESLTAELRTLDQRRNNRRWNEITRALWRLQLESLLGVPGGVVVRFQLMGDPRRAKINNATGTLVAMRRTRAEVDFGEHGEWDFAIGDLLPASMAANRGRAMSSFVAEILNCA